MFLLSPWGAKRIMMGDAAVCGKSSPACRPRVDRRGGNYCCSRGAAASAARVFGIRKFAICDPKYPRPFFGAGCVSGAAGENTCKKVFPLSGQRMFVENFFEGRTDFGEKRLCKALPSGNKCRLTGKPGKHVPLQTQREALDPQRRSAALCGKFPERPRHARYVVCFV